MVHIVGPSGAGKAEFLAELARHPRTGSASGRPVVGRGSTRLAWLRARWPSSAPTPRSSRVVDGAEPGARCAARSWS